MCDVGGSCAWAKVIPARNAEETARFRTEVLVPAFAQAGSRLQRVLTDQGGPRKAEFDEARRARGSPTGARSRGPRGQTGSWSGSEGIIPHEHGRAAFRRRCFTRARPLQTSRAGFLRFDNEERPHPRHRTRGRPPPSCSGAWRLTRQPPRPDVSAPVRLPAEAVQGRCLSVHPPRPLGSSFQFWVFGSIVCSSWASGRSGGGSLATGVVVPWSPRTSATAAQSHASTHRVRTCSRPAASVTTSRTR